MQNERDQLAATGRVFILALGAAVALVSLGVYFDLLPAGAFPIYFSSPSLATREDMETNIAWQTAFTIGRCLIAFALALATYLLVLVAFSWRLPRYVRALGAILQAIPPLVFAPLLLLAFGANERTLILAASAFSLFGLIVSSPDRDPTRSSRADFSRLAQQSPTHRWTALYLPEALASMRNVFSMLWLVLVGVVVVLEYLGGTQGFGRAMSVLVSYAEISSVAFASLVLAAGAGTVSFGLRGSSAAASDAAEYLGG